MASEEERARIMAEYLAEANNGDAEEEEEFQEEDEEDDDDDEYQKKPSEVNCPVLQGRLKLNDEQHLVYLGTWCMKVDLGKGERNKKTTFKLKSVEPMPQPFSLDKPPTDQKLKMNGFFHTDATDQIEAHRKIKEKGVTVQFLKEAGKSYEVKGEGTNEFGMFALKGTYLPNKEKETYWLQCEKYYGGIPNDDDDSDEIDSEDDQKDPQELDDLQDDADLTVEELQAKYYGGANVPSPPKAKSSSNKTKAEREERRKKRNSETEQDDSKPVAKKPKQEEEQENLDTKPKAKSSSPSPKKKIVVTADDDDGDDCGF